MDSFSILSPNKPMVMVHKGWKTTSAPQKTTSNNTFPSHPEGGNSSIQLPETKKEEESPVMQEFEFINGTNPFRNRDPEVRKLVRAHVVKDATRKRKQLREKSINAEKRAQKRKKSDYRRELEKRVTFNPLSISTYPGNQTSEDRFSSFVLSRNPSTSSFISPGLDPHPHLSPIIYHISTMGTAMWPLEGKLGFNPISPSLWFDWALSDDALFHALLYTTSSYAGLITGTTENKESIVHVGRSLRLVNERLMGREVAGVFGEIAEGTLGAITCWALTECLRGNIEGWRVHMKGIKHMVDVKGGMEKLSTTLQLKVHRVDLTGAIDSLGNPFFSIGNSLPSPYSLTWQSFVPDQRLRELLSALAIDESLHTVLYSLSNLSNEVSRLLSISKPTTIPEQIKLLKATYSLRYALLPSTSPVNISSIQYVDPVLDEVIRVGALLYIQATLQEFPLSALGSRNLVRRLRERVMLVQIRSRGEGELMVWLLFMGGIESKDAGYRGWFVEQIGKLVARLGMRRWEEVKRALEGLWCIEKVHEERCKRLWNEVVGLGIGTNDFFNNGILR